MTAFTAIWLGQSISLIGYNLSNLALGIWMYQQTNSITYLSLISIANTLPVVIISPLAGVIVDRYDRRQIMIISDLGAALSVLTIAILIFSNALNTWHIYVAVAVSAFFSSFQWPAYLALMTTLVPQQRLGRANGMQQLSQAFAQILSPFMGTLLLSFLHIKWIIVIDFLSCMAGVFMLVITKTPKINRNPEPSRETTLIRDSAFGWNYIRQRRELFGILMIMGFVNFLVGILTLLLTPLILSFQTTTSLGTVLSGVGLGMLIGGLIMSIWGGPRKKVSGMIILLFLCGLSVFFIGIRPSLFIIGLSVLAFSVIIPVINGTMHTIWQSQVPLEIQGRVFAVRGMIVMLFLPLSYFIAGQMSEKYFEPLLAENGLLSRSVGQWIGVGPGRGIGLLILLTGLITSVLALFAYTRPGLRTLDAGVVSVSGSLSREKWSAESAKT